MGQVVLQMAPGQQPLQLPMTQQPFIQVFPPANRFNWDVSAASFSHQVGAWVPDVSCNF